jgi:hypothetical protein
LIDILSFPRRRKMVGVRRGAGSRPSAGALQL